MYKLVLLVVLVTNKVYHVSSAVPQWWDMDDKTSISVVQGETFTLKCLFSEVGFSDSMDLKKKISDEITVTVLSYSAGLRADYDTLTDRYNFTPLANPGDVEDAAAFTLEISDASPKDGGEYVCTSAEDETDVLEVVIDVPVRDVMWRELDTDGSISNNSPKDSMHLIEGQDGGILCLVHVNSNVKPEVRISADGNTFESGWEKLYLTSPLQISDLANVYNYETTLYMQYYTASPSYLLHGRTVKCESWTSGFDSGNNIKVDEVAMTVEFSPVLECGTDGNKVYGLPGDYVTINCTLIANPQPAAMDVYVSWSESGVEKSKNVQSVDDEFEFRWDMTDEDTGTSEIIFRLLSVKETYYTYNFTFHSENKHGSATAPITLVKASDSTSASWRVSGSALALLIVYLFAANVVSS